MLLEFDADQRLCRKPCATPSANSGPPALVRGVAEDGVDPTPVWMGYVEHGWTEMSDPDTAVELAIVLEELGTRHRPHPVPGDDEPVRAVGGGSVRPARIRDRRLQRGERRTGTVMSGCSTVPPGTCWTATARSGWRW